MKQYELSVLFRPELEENIDEAISSVKSIIEQAGGTVTKEDNTGKKRLAYQINREDFAVYVYFDLDLPADAPLKISNTLNITETVMRYLLVKADVKGRAALEEEATRAASREQAESN